MPRKKRNDEEIDNVKEIIIKEAIDLIVKEGLAGFSIRKIGPRLGIAPKTIYNYFRNKEEIHLIILTRGFEELNKKLIDVCAVKRTPIKKLEGIVRVYFNFAFDNPQLYNIMYLRPVPKYKDIAIDELKDFAQTEFNAYQKGVDLMTDVIKQFGTPKKIISDEEAKFYLFSIWCVAHGYIAGCLNTILDYLIEGPIQLRDFMIDRIIYIFKQDMMLRTKKRGIGDKALLF